MKKRLQAWGDSKIVPIVSCLVLDDQDRLLLLRRHAENLGGNKWGPPGGRIEAHETAEEAMRRELLEETGLRPKQLLLLGTHEVSMPHGRVHMTTYYAQVPSDSEVRLETWAHQAYRWFPITDLLTKSQDILWGVPTVLRDFGLLDRAAEDSTLHDGSQIQLLSRFTRLES